MQICIYGAGAIGGYMGVLLRKPAPKSASSRAARHLAAIGATASSDL